MNKMFFYPHHSGVVCTSHKNNLPVVPFSPQINGSYKSLKENIHVCTPNPGNLIHSESPSRVFKCDINNSSKGNLSSVIKSFKSISEAAKFFDDNYDCLVLSFANDIRVGWETEDHKLFSQLIREVQVNIYAFGLGLQEKIDGDLSSLMPNVLSLIEALDEKATLFGVRGFETEHWLRENGIKNAVALGCPSMYRNPKNVLLAIEKAKGKNFSSLVAAGYAHNKQRHKPLVDLLNTASGCSMGYIFQNDLFAVFNEVNLENNFNFYDYSSSKVNFDITDKRLKNLHRNNQPFNEYYFFTNSFSWLQLNASYDLFIGDRLHAAICALLSGTPALLLYSDIRVKEIANFYGIPCFDINKLDNITFDELIDKCFSLENLNIFKNRYLKRLRAFSDVCETNCLELIEKGIINDILIRG